MSQPSILTVLMGTLVLTCPWWIPIMQNVNKQIENLERQNIRTEKRIKLWNKIIESYDPMYGDFTNHIFLWLTHNSHYNNDVDWWDYRIIELQLKHFISTDTKGR
jgi:hypothetical protein